MNAMLHLAESRRDWAPLAEPRLAVVMPARDEAAVVGRVIVSVKEKFPRALVVVIDDASVDATSEMAERAGARVLRLPVPLGAWGAIQAGMRYALRQGCDTVVTMDADGQHLAEEIVKLLETRRREAADVVIGAYPRRGSLARRLAWEVFRWLSGFSHVDLTSGFRVYGYRALCLLASPRATLLEYQDLGVLMLLRRAGLETAEVAVSMGPRVEGKSRIFSNWWKVAVYLFQTVLLCLAGLHFLRRGK